MSFHLLLQQGVTILTASRRLAHAVRLDHARRSQAHGMLVWETPRVMPWSTWLRQQQLEARTVDTQAAQLRVLKPAQARVLWDEIVGGSRVAADLLNPSSAARLAARSWTRLQDHLLSFRQLQSFETAEAQALYGWCSEFTRRCESLAAIDEARLSHWAFDTQWIPSERIAVAGFDTQTPAMARLIDRWRQLGIVADAPEEAEAGTVTVVDAPDLATEIDWAAQWARDQVEEGATSVGVVVPDLQVRRDEVWRVFEDVLAPGARRTGSVVTSLPIVMAAPSPLSSFPLIDAALQVLQLAAGEASSTLVGRILRSPFLAGGDAERAQRAHADLRLREEQRDRWDWMTLERWASVNECEELQLAARGLNELIRALPSSALSSEWVERFHAIWLSIGWPGDRTPSSAEYQTLLKFQDVLAEFGSLDAVAGRMGLRRALGRLQELLGDTPFEPETVDAAITVIDAHTSAGMRFDAIWVVGLHADSWPPAASPDPLIPLELQRAAGMPECTSGGVLQQATAQLQRWSSSAERLVLSWPARNADIELSPSPLIARLRRPQDVFPITVRSMALREQLFHERPVLDTLRDDRAPPLPRQAARGGARTIELQSRCPFRAQAELRLRAQPLSRVRPGVEPVDRGAILHDVLADVWGDLRTQQRLLDQDDLLLESRVRESVQRHTMQTLMPDTASRTRLAWLEIESIVRQILVLLQQEKLRPPFSVHLAETAEPFEIGGLSITLRPDRIDLLQGGGELLVDYKLGAGNRQRDWFDLWPGRPRRPQLPLYGLARADRLCALAYVVLAPGAVEYRGWSDGTDVATGVVPYPSGIRIDLGDPSDWDALVHHWSFTLTRLAEAYVGGDAVVDPLPQECATCHLSTLCRIHDSSSEEAEVGRDDD